MRVVFVLWCKVFHRFVTTPMIVMFWPVATATHVAEQGMRVSLQSRQGCSPVLRFGDCVIVTRQGIELTYPSSSLRQIQALSDMRTTISG